MSKPLDLSSGWCGFGWFKPVVGTPDDESSRESSDGSEHDHLPQMEALRRIAEDIDRG